MNRKKSQSNTGQEGWPQSTVNWKTIPVGGERQSVQNNATVIQTAQSVWSQERELIRVGMWRQILTINPMLMSAIYGMCSGIYNFNIHCVLL